MGMFVVVNIAREKCPESCTECVAACPVKVFQGTGPAVATLADNEDECTFCDLCLDRCPKGAITISTTYSSKVRTARATA